MSIETLFDCKGTLMRAVQEKDGYRTPQASVLQEVGSYPCAVTRHTISAASNAPMVQSDQAYRIYFPISVPVLDGDVAVIPGHGKFRLSAPYRPRGHHIEVDGRWEGEA